MTTTKHRNDHICNQACRDAQDAADGIRQRWTFAGRRDVVEYSEAPGYFLEVRPYYMWHRLSRRGRVIDVHRIPVSELLRVQA